MPRIRPYWGLHMNMSIYLYIYIYIRITLTVLGRARVLAKKETFFCSSVDE